VVLLDVMMPGKLDGLQVLDAIKSDRRCMDTFVAVISARGQQADKDEAYRFGADAYFTKPFSPISLVNWVRARFQ
jgi:DNA-binding response OmpR family regulator